jgi:hypothetical protein
MAPMFCSAKVIAMRLVGQNWKALTSWRPLSYLMVGVLIAGISSISVLDPQGSLWNNDEGYFLSLVQSREALWDIRYSFFVFLGKLYFALLSNAFAVVLVHKLLMLTLFVVMFYERISKRYGEAIYIGLYVVFVYLNQFYLRDSLVFICSLLVVYFGMHRTEHGGVYVGLGGLVFLRPQALLLYARPCLTLVVGIIFLLFFHGRYAASQLPDSMFFMHWDFWSQFAYTAAAAVYGCNPFGKLSWYLENKQYLGFILLVLASLPLSMLCAQLFAASAFREFRFPGWDRALAGLIVMILLYAALGIFADVRVFFASLCPFFLHIQRCFLTMKSVFLVVLALVFLMLMRVVVSAIASQ